MSAPTLTSQPRVLRRSSTDRVFGGVCGGLGQYFNVDPVLFRVLFATTAFFGGLGLIAYLAAWAVIPEQGSTATPADRWFATLRRRRVPFWPLVIAAVLVLWVAGVAWWAPGPFIAVPVALLAVCWYFGRRGVFRQASATPGYPPPSGYPAPQSGYPAPPSSYPASPPAGPTVAAPPPPRGVNLTKQTATGPDSPHPPGPVFQAPPAAGAAAPPAPPPAPEAAPGWQSEAAAWFAEARQASRERFVRARPLRLGTLGVLVLALIALVVADVTVGIPIVAYGIVLAGIVVAGVLLGLVLGRTSWLYVPLLVIAVPWMVAFAGSRASLHDGIGEYHWTPTGAPAAHYRIGVGQARLDLTQLGPIAAPRTVQVRSGAGQVEIILPPRANIRVQGHVGAGEIDVDGGLASYQPRHGGFEINRTVSAPSGASGPLLTIDVHLANGRLHVVRR